ncbi:hypothetical protein OAU50_00880 [Planctomycetota bacterium]|nr:hypothetical protein [Planctomycetota bacterium]
MRYACLLIVLITAGCTIGTTTSDRPALVRPAVGPDGVTWDAYLAAQRGDAKAFRHALSVRYLHSHLLPAELQNETRTEADFFEEEARLLKEIEPKYTGVIDKMLKRMMETIQTESENRMMEASKPRYEIEFKDSWGRAKGPNIAWVTVRFHNLDVQPTVETSTLVAPDEDTPPTVPGAAKTIKVRLVQAGQRWIIDGFEPDDLMGAFTR